MFSRRDLILTSVALCIGISVGHVATAASHPDVRESALSDWESLTPSATGVGQYRQVVRAPTATLGKLEATSNGKTKVLGPGSIIFNAANQLHGVRNVGNVPATYHVINWASPGALKKKAAPTPREPMTILLRSEG